MMQTLANAYRSKNITYSSFVTDSAASNMTENLKREAGLDQSSEYTQLLIIYSELYRNVYNVNVD